MRRTRVLLALFTIMALPGLFAPIDTNAEGYRFVDRKKLDRELKQWVGKTVTFTDRLVMVYAEEQGGYLRFDTHYFRCAIKIDNEKASAYLRELFDKAVKQYADLRDEMKKAKSPKEKRAILWKIHKRWKNKPIVTVFGKVDRPKFWGDVDPDGSSNGVVSEHIMMVVDRIEKPRKRWYEEIR